jgi:hypothetical protein
MAVSTTESASYPGEVAKVEISIPDDLLVRIDEFVKRSGESRSDLLQRLAERELAADDARRSKEFKELLGPPPPKDVGTGIDLVQAIREDRDNNHGH